MSDINPVLPEAPAESRLPVDPAEVPDRADVSVPRDLERRIREAMGRYPELRSASIPALWAVQRHYGWCTPDGIVQAAAVMGVTPGYLEGVATFYDLFHTEPVGEHRVLVCTNISCWLRGADELLDSFCEAAGTAAGETGEGEEFFVRGFECLGACDLAPMASIDERYYGPLEPGDAASAVEQLRSGEQVLPDRALAERGSAGGIRAGADERISSHPLNKPTRPRPKAAPDPKPSPYGNASKRKGKRK